MRKRIKRQVEGDRSWMQDWGMKLECPIEGCGFDYVHMDKSSNVDGKDNWEAWEGRGDSLIIPMYCEEGHQWIMRVGFHKGFTFLGNESHPEGDFKWYPPEEEPTTPPIKK